MENSDQIIVIKKKKGHHGHHGGAWKVAYADFVTAMMALFMVLWLMNTSKPVQDAISGYFRDPSGTASKKGGEGSKPGQVAEVKKDDMAKLKEELVKSMEKMAGFEKLKDQIEMKITPEGLRIELLESSKGTFFENGKPQPTAALASLLKILAADVGKLPNTISIEGHTDAKPYSSPETYSNWELSTDRANMARRLMESAGIRTDQVVQVRGYAYHNLRDPEHPGDASNRRVSVIVQYQTPLPPGVLFDGSTSLSKIKPTTGGGDESKPKAEQSKPKAGSEKTVAEAKESSKEEHK